MKREFLKGLELSEGVIESIMAEHGRTVNDLKADLKTSGQTAEQLRDQLQERDKQLEDLKKKAGDNEDLKTTIDQLKAQNEQEKQQLIDQMNRQTLDYAVDKALLQNKVRVPRGALMAVLENPEAIQLGKDGEVLGLSEQLDKAKEAYPFMFETETVTDPAPGSQQKPGYNPGPPHQRGNNPGVTDPAELGRQKALERHAPKQEEVKQ